MIFSGLLGKKLANHLAKNNATKTTTPNIRTESTIIMERNVEVECHINLVDVNVSITQTVYRKLACL